jgi:hypothetical protein
MSKGRVYLWTPDPLRPLGGRVAVEVVPLLRLDASNKQDARLRGQYVCVRNGGAVNTLDPISGMVHCNPLGDACPDGDGNFFFEPGRGGGRMDKKLVAEPKHRCRYEQAAHFGEVNTYYHLDLVAAYIHELLGELKAAPLPCVTAVVNAHHAATEAAGYSDGIRHQDRWLPFQGGHYRLPARRYDMTEPQALAPHGEIHLGPGRKLLHHGALVEATGRAYRANASHNAGILYHEYGHHLARHTADFRGNALRRRDRQNNRKPAIEEGTCDYLAATMLNTPHIWAWHRRHDSCEIHPRSLLSPKTMADFATGAGADAHDNGTIWAAALWDLRTLLGARLTDLLLLQALVLIGSITVPDGPMAIARMRQAKKGYGAGLTALIHVDRLLSGSQNRRWIENVFAKRGIYPDQETPWDQAVAEGVPEDRAALFGADEISWPKVEDFEL